MQSIDRRLRRAAHCLAAVLAAAAVAPALAQTPPATPDSAAVAVLRAEIAALRGDYEERLDDLERQLAELRAELDSERAGAPASGEPAAPPPADPLAALREAARAAAAAPAAATGGSEPVASGGRSLNRYNPEISFTGDLLAVASSDAREEFQDREFELDFQSALDPYSRTRWTIAYGDEGVEVEEGYIVYPALPGGLGLTAGRFRQQFGALNRQHLHALPQSDYPLALATYFGDEGLAQTGISARWLLPRPWATANELTLELTDGENEGAFGGQHFEDLAGLAHLKNFWELSDAAWFELGLSGAAGRTAEREDHRIWGTDLTFHWQPPSRAKYRELTWRTELLLSDLDLPGGGSEQAWGGYTYAEGLVAQNLYAGARVDLVEDPLDPSRSRWGVVPYLTWWQSEYVRLRGEYRYFEDRPDGASEDGFRLQLTWAAGPHKHETY